MLRSIMQKGCCKGQALPKFPLGILNPGIACIAEVSLLRGQQRNASYSRRDIGNSGRALVDLYVSMCGRKIQYMTERVDNKERWVGAIQNSEVPRILINGPADPISGAHAAEG